MFAMIIHLLRLLSSQPEACQGWFPEVSGNPTENFCSKQSQGYCWFIGKHKTDITVVDLSQTKLMWYQDLKSKQSNRTVTTI